MPPRGPVQQPADIGRELLRLRSRQQHAVVQRMQEPAFGDPVLLLDQDAVHHRDLPGRAAEAEHGDPQPDPEGFAEADAVTGMPPACLLRSSLTALPCWWASCGFRRMRRGTSDRRRRRAPCRPPAARDRHHTCATARAKPPAARLPPATGRAVPVSAPRTIVASRSRGGVAEAEFLDHDVEGAELAAMAPEHVFDVEGRGVEALADRDHLGRRDEQKHRRRDRRSGGSARGRRCGRSSVARA